MSYLDCLKLTIRQWVKVYPCVIVFWMIWQKLYFGHLEYIQHLIYSPHYHIVGSMVIIPIAAYGKYIGNLYYPRYFK